MVDRDQFREAMSRLGAAVNIITSAGKGGRHGMTASAVCSVTDTPPTVLVCINRSSSMNDVVKDNRVLCVNVLGGGHDALSNRFANKTLSSEERFVDTQQWRQLETGSPVLKTAPVALDCNVVDQQEVGTHTVFYCTVQALQFGAQRESLIYFNRAYHSLVDRKDVHVEKAPDLYAMINSDVSGWL